MQTQAKDIRVCKIEYRNAVYYGENIRSNDETENAIKQGIGLVLYDGGQIVFGNWENDELEGEYVYIGNSIRAFGTAQNSQLTRFNMLSSTQPQRQKQQIKLSTKSIYGLFHGNQVFGKGVLIDDEQIYQLGYEEGQPKEIIKKSQISQLQVDEYFRQFFFHNTVFELPSFLRKMIEKHINKSQTSKLKCICKSYEKNHVFYGFVESFSRRQYGFVMQDNELVSAGEYRDGLLHGIGASYKSKQKVQEGVFAAGSLIGIGVEFNKKNNKYIFGNFGEHKLRTIKEGFGWPEEIIKELRLEFHLRSPVYSYNYMDSDFFRTVDRAFERSTMIPLADYRNYQTQKHRRQAINILNSNLNTSYTSIRSGRAETMHGYPRKSIERVWNGSREKK